MRKKSSPLNPAYTSLLKSEDGSREHTKCSTTQTNSHDGTQKRIRFQMTPVFAKMPGKPALYIYFLRSNQYQYSQQDKLSVSSAVAIKKCVIFGSVAKYLPASFRFYLSRLGNFISQPLILFSCLDLS